MVERTAATAHSARRALAVPWWAQPAAIALAVLGLYMVAGTLMAIGHDQGGASGPFMNWDGIWYQRIVEHGYAPGYTPDHAGQRPAAFFPLFPGTVALLHTLMPRLSLQAVGLGLNALAVTAALCILDRSISDWPARQRAGYCVLVVTVPGALFYACFYTEALFLLGVALVVLGLRTPGRLGVACLGAAIACADRPPGVFLLAAVLAAVVMRERHRPARLTGLAALACSGVALVLTVDWALAGNPLAFLSAEAGWAQYSLGFHGVLNALKVIADDVFIHPHPLLSEGWGFLLVAVVVGLCAVAWRWDRRLAATAAAAAALPVWFLEIPSIARYLAVLLPIACMGALAVLRERRGTWVVVGVAAAGGLALNLLWLHRFVNGLFIG